VGCRSGNFPGRAASGMEGGPSCWAGLVSVWAVGSLAEKRMVEIRPWGQTQCGPFPLVLSASFFFISLLRKETDEVDILQRLLTLMTQLTQRRGVPVREKEEVKESQPPPSRRHSTVAHTTRPGGERYSSVARQAGLPQPSQRPAGRLASSSPGRAG
jgi:hypothetical protein